MSWLVTCFGNSVSLKSQRSHLDTLGYLVGYIIAKDNEVTAYTWEVKDFLPVLSKKNGYT